MDKLIGDKAMPSAVNRTVPLRGPDTKPRKYLTQEEVERLMAAAKGNRWGHRDATMILLAFRHALRCSELVGLEWCQVDFNAASLAVRRAKGGTGSTHPLAGDELRALRRLRREGKGAFVFTSERGAPFTPSGFARLLQRAGEAAGLPFKPNPHSLRHATGYALANRGVDTRTLQAFMGHGDIRSTVTYAELSPKRFCGLWDR
jgi:type 1 fimbriae regulatory protein FimB/type 1 fimbriae regulatory protein FimE